MFSSGQDLTLHYSSIHPGRVMGPAQLCRLDFFKVFKFGNCVCDEVYTNICHISLDSDTYMLVPSCAAPAAQAAPYGLRWNPRQKTGRRGLGKIRWSRGGSRGGLDGFIHFFLCDALNLMDQPLKSTVSWWLYSRIPNLPCSSGSSCSPCIAETLHQKESPT